MKRSASVKNKKDGYGDMAGRAANLSANEIRPRKATKKQKSIDLHEKAERDSYLTNHSKVIWDMHNKGIGPAKIARLLLMNAGLNGRSDAITGKQVSNWINYRKKSGQHSTFPVSSKNGNILANFSDSCVLFINLLTYFFLLLLGQDDSRSIAEQDGEPLDDFIEDGSEESEEEEEEDSEAEIASKYLRYFVHSEKDSFSLFVECGIQRKFTTKIIDETQIELKVEIPVPQDSLLQTAGYHAVNSSLEPVDSTFIIDAPRRLSNLQILKYPDDVTPLWLIFKYDLEVEKVQESSVVSVDLSAKLFGEKAKEIK